MNVHPSALVASIFQTDSCLVFSLVWSPIVVPEAPSSEDKELSLLRPLLPGISAGLIIWKYKGALVVKLALFKVNKK